MKNFYISFVLVVVQTVTVLGADERVAIVEKSGIEHGVVVHVGPTDIGLMKAFAQRDNVLFHVLTTDPVVLKDMRASVTQAQATNRAHITLVPGYKRLPYADNLINLLVIDFDSLVGEAPSQDEIMRVLVPQPLGVAAIKKGGKWKLHSKPRTKAMGSWEHHRKDANGNMATNDRGGIPSGVQWLAGPLYVSQGRKSSTQAVLSAAGRNIYLSQNVKENELFPNHPFMLEARDAFNGLLIWQRLWKGPNRIVPKDKWPKRKIVGAESARWGGDGQTSFAVVATPELVFAVEDGSPIALDAKTGKLIRTYSCTDAEQIVVCKDTLIAQTQAGVSVFSINSEAPRWSVKLPTAKEKEPRNVRNTRLACGTDRIYFLDNIAEQLIRRGAVPAPSVLHCFSLKDGKKQWSISLLNPAVGSITMNFANDRVIGIAQKQKLEVYSGIDGKLLWSQANPFYPRNGILQQSGNFLTNEGVWVRSGRYDWDVVTPETGKLVRKFKTGMRFKNGCQGAILSGSHLVASRASTFFDRKTGKKTSVTFARGGCGVGFIPANGLHYTIPHACACVNKSLRGLIGLRGDHSIPGDDYPTVLVSSPKMSQLTENSDSPWATFCASSARDCFSPTDLPTEMRLIWKKQLVKKDNRVASREWSLRYGAPLTQSVMDEKRVYTGIINTHQLIALDAASGELSWSYTAEGRISAPPTLYKGLCLFGDHAGFVYCLNSTDGSLRWRLHAARKRELIMAYGQLESPWPVEGGVIVAEGVVVFLCGRADGADGGVMAFGVDPLTGKEIWRKPVIAESGVAGYLTQGDNVVYAMGTTFKAMTGEVIKEKEVRLLNAVRSNIADLNDGSWVHMSLARRKGLAMRYFSGRGLVDVRGSLVAVGNQGGKALAIALRSGNSSGGNLIASGAFKWNFDVKHLGSEINSLVVANDKVVISGLKEQQGKVALLSARDGSQLWSLNLPAPPVHHGLAVGFGRLYISCSDGTLHCYGE